MSVGARLTLVFGCVIAFLWGGTTVAAWSSGEPFASAALKSAGTIGTGVVLAWLLLAAMFWAMKGR